MKFLFDKRQKFHHSSINSNYPADENSLILSRDLTQFNQSGATNLSLVHPSFGMRHSSVTAVV